MGDFEGATNNCYCDTSKFAGKKRNRSHVIRRLQEPIVSPRFCLKKP